MIRCPILNKDIDIGECVTIADVCDGVAKESVISDTVKKVTDWKEVCKNCKYHNN